MQFKSNVLKSIVILMSWRTDWRWVNESKLIELLNLSCKPALTTWLTVKLEVNVMIPVEAECDKTYTATVQHVWDNSALSEALLLLSSEYHRGLSCSSPIWNWQYWMPVSWQCLEAAYWHLGDVMMGHNITFLMIFLLFSVYDSLHVTINMCIKYSFFYIYH